MTPDIITEIEVPPTATAVTATVPLSTVQAAAASFGIVIEISVDNQATWDFATSHGFQGGPDRTDTQGNALSRYQLVAQTDKLPLPPTAARVRLTNPSDPTLAPTLEAQ